MGIVAGGFNLVTGGKGNIGAWNRNAMIWKGRAEAKRLRARVDALETNQDMLNSRQAQQGGAIAGGETPQEQVKDTLKNINPLNVKNLTVTQIVVAGGTKKDRLKAQKTAEKNTKILEQFARATKEIEKNTKEVHKQDTKIRKKTYKDYAKDGVKKARKLALKAAAATKNWFANMKDTLISLLPSLITAALLSMGGVLGKGFKMLSDLARGGSKEKRAAKARWAKIKAEIKTQIAANNKKVNLRFSKAIGKVKLTASRNAGMIKVLQGQIIACCGKGKRKPKRKGGNRKGGNKGSNKGSTKNTQTKTTKTTKPKVKVSAAAKKAAAETVKKAGRRSLMKKVLGGLGKGALRSLAAMAGAAAFAGPLIGLAIGAWTAYEIGVMGLTATGLVSEEQVEQFESWIVQTIKSGALKAWEYAKNKAKKLLSDKRQTKITNARYIKSANIYYNTAEEELEKLKKSIKNQDKEYVIRRHRDKFVKAVLQYNKTVEFKHAKSAEMELYIQRHISKRTAFGFFAFPTPKMKMDEAMFITAQMEIWRTENKAQKVNEDNIKGTNVRSSGVDQTNNVYQGNISLKSGEKKLKSFAALGTSLSQVGVTDTDIITFTLDTPVDGLFPPIWKPLAEIVPAAFRKVIDYIENGNTANYALKGKRSSAFGRYQFMPKTATWMVTKLKDPAVKQDNWKIPEHQDKIFGELCKTNMKILEGYKGKGVTIDLMSMWIAHNLGPGAVPWMTKKISSPGKASKKNIDNQLSKAGKTIEESRELYLQTYNAKIAKAINAPIGKATPYGQTDGSGTLGKAGANNGATRQGGGVSGGAYGDATSGSYGALPSLKVEPWTGEADVNVNMKDVITLVGGGLRPDAWRMLKPEFKTRILQAASAYNQMTGKKLIITSAYRNPKKQAALFAASDRSGHKVAAPGRSMHNWGLAIDLGGSTGLDRGKGNQGDVLFASGILDKYKLWRPMSWEPWHIEPIESKTQKRGRAGEHMTLTQGATTASGASYSQTPTGFNTPVAGYAPVVVPGAGINPLNSLPGAAGKPVSAKSPTGSQSHKPSGTFDQAAVLQPKK